MENTKFIKSNLYTWLYIIIVGAMFVGLTWLCIWLIEIYPFSKALEDDKGKVKLSFGKIIGAVDIVGSYKIVENYGVPALYLGASEFKAGDTTQTFKFENVMEPELSFGDYTPGRFAWKLENPRMLKEPIPHKGSQGWGKFIDTNNQIIFK